MKSTITKNKRARAAKEHNAEPSRSVKIADYIHYQLRIYAAQRRMGIQEFIEELLVADLKRLGRA